MADKKISQLTAASTPLAGTEVLPIVQSGSTVKVAVVDVVYPGSVTPAKLSSGAPAWDTSGNVGLNNNSGPGRLLPRSGTMSGGVLIGDGSGWSYSWKDSIGAVLASIDDGGLATFKNNIIVGTAAKGINFSANTGAAGKTSSLLNWYEEGTWTPTVNGASGTTYTTQNGWYTRIGNLVTIGFELTINAAGTIAGGAAIAGLPFTSAATYKSSGSLSFAGTVVTSTVWQGLVIGASQSVLTVYVKTAASASTTSINGSDFFGAGTQLIGLLTYRV